MGVGRLNEPGTNNLVADSGGQGGGCFDAGPTRPASKFQPTEQNEHQLAKRQYSNPIGEHPRGVDTVLADWSSDVKAGSPSSIFSPVNNMLHRYQEG